MYVSLQILFVYGENIAHLSYDNYTSLVSRYQCLPVRRENDMCHLVLMLGERHDA